MGILSTLGLKRRSAAEIAAGLKHKRELAIKEEGLAKLRSKEQAFNQRIEKARHKAMPKPHSAHRQLSMGGMFGSSGFGSGSGGIGGQSEYFDSMFGAPKPAPAKKRKKKKSPQYVMVKV